jgi:hypothetical protein
MDQNANAGHHAITREAVHLFFQHANPPDGRVNGMDEEAYFRALDSAQQAQDVSTQVAGHDVPTWGTSVSGAFGPDHQREHGMADPYRSGASNLATNEQYVQDQVAASRHGNEMQHLGAAAHALEDSYSEAHAWRTDAANHGDPTAAVESINVFDPTPGVFVDPSHGVHGVGASGGVATGLSRTHDERFDEVPVVAGTDLDHLPAGQDVQLVHGSDRAAAEATARMLETNYRSQAAHESDADAAAHEHATVGQFYQSATPGGPHVNLAPDSVWSAERDHRLQEHQSEDAAFRAAHPGQTITAEPGADATAPPVATSAAPADSPDGGTADPDNLPDGGLPPGGVPNQ